MRNIVEMAQKMLEELAKGPAEKDSGAGLREEGSSAQAKEGKDSSGAGEVSQGRKTKHLCAINEKELNKVELAFFRRPMNGVIYSDK